MGACKPAAHRKGSVRVQPPLAMQDCIALTQQLQAHVCMDGTSVCYSRPRPSPPLPPTTTLGPAS